MLPLQTCLQAVDRLTTITVLYVFFHAIVCYYADLIGQIYVPFAFAFAR